MLLHLAGEEVQCIFETFGNLKENNCPKVKVNFTEYFKPPKNIAYDRHFDPANYRKMKQWTIISYD